jgi:hypothetical protein
MARSRAASAWTALFALQMGAGCSSTADGQPAAAGSGESGAGGKGSGGATSQAMASASSSAVVGPATGAGGGGGAFVCNPPAPPGTIFERTAIKYGEVDPVSMCTFRGDVMLIVNTAAL